MNTWANTVLTDQGRTLLAKLTKGNSLNVTRAITGAGFVTPGLLAKQTEVTDPRQAIQLQPVTYPEPGTCKLPVLLHNNGLTVGYEATQVGVFATDPDVGEILLFISQAADSASGTTIPSGREMPGFSAEWAFYLKYVQADTVNVTVDPSGYVTWANIDAYIKENAISKEMAEELIDETFEPITEEEIIQIFGAAPGTGGSSAKVTEIDFSNFENGTFTETVNGVTVSHSVAFDDSGRPVAIDDITIKW